MHRVLGLAALTRLPLFAVLPSELDAAKCSATGDGLSRARAGVPASFRIKAADGFGNVRHMGGDAFEVRVSRSGAGISASTVNGTVDDVGAGVYAAAYVVNFSGTFEVAVTSAGEQLHLERHRQIAVPSWSHPACRKSLKRR
jgi:Filamin/ABP280 repeat